MSPRRIHRITGARLYFIPVRTRLPLKFGPETLTSVTCARVALRVADEQGNEAEGWGETPLSVQWVWPSPLSYEQRHSMLKEFCCRLASAWMKFTEAGHPLELGYNFQQCVLLPLLRDFNETETEAGSGDASPHSHQFPLTPALSPSAGERENRRLSRSGRSFPLSPAEGERAEVRGKR